MKKLRSYRFLGILLSLSLLVITSGVTISKHYCLGRLQSVAYFSEASKCLDMNSMPMEDMGCCADESEEYKVKYAVQESFDFEINELVLLSLAYSVFDSVIVSESYDPAFYAHYKPPLITSDIPVKVQSFLI